MFLSWLKVDESQNKYEYSLPFCYGRRVSKYIFDVMIARQIPIINSIKQTNLTMRKNE